MFHLMFDLLLVDCGSLVRTELRKAEILFDRLRALAQSGGQTSSQSQRLVECLAAGGIADAKIVGRRFGFKQELAEVESCLRMFEQIGNVVERGAQLRENVAELGELPNSLIASFPLLLEVSPGESGKDQSMMLLSLVLKALADRSACNLWALRH